ncbi:hypothetical protein WR25_01600 [Diploscapter pachys]|uniref:Small RNA 2'-O-methyltransferase n=1 Tax=Diploscapter pachys TaxID=2018661 RepID=A0A2A2KJV2_9BILA|nr:hypothetical protein WR25_01600 [Diploscapter pachys]
MSDPTGGDNPTKVGAEQENSETEQKNDKKEEKEKNPISMKSMSDWVTQFEDDQLQNAYLEINQLEERRPVELTVNELQEIVDSGSGCGYEEHEHRHENNRRFFSPPLQYQRNACVRDLIFSYSKRMVLSKLAVLGCGELSLECFLMHDFPRLSIERIYSVDLSHSSLLKGIHNFRKKLGTDLNMIESTHKFPVFHEVFLGSILDLDSRIADADVVVSTEVIEHMTLENATEFAETVLLKYQPRIFIMSTPNTEYNKVFNPVEEGQPPFRHADHHFEFNRDEFFTWVYKLMEKTNEVYEFEIEYVGEIRGYEYLEGATQFVTFWKTENAAKEKLEKVEIEGKNFKLVANDILPFGLRQLVFGKITEQLIDFLTEMSYEKMDEMRDPEMPNWWMISRAEITKRAKLPEFLFKNGLITEDIIFNIIALGTRRTVKYGNYENDFKFAFSRPEKIQLLINDIKRYQKMHLQDG